MLASFEGAVVNFSTSSHVSLMDKFHVKEELHCKYRQLYYPKQGLRVKNTKQF